MSVTQIAPYDISGVVHEGRPFLDAVTVMHGPRHELSRFFLLADGFIRGWGCHLRLHDNLSTLVPVNAALRESWGPLGPMFDPQQSRIEANTAFWFSVHADDGAVVATYATRLFELSGTDLAEELRHFRIHYADPQPHIEAGARCLVEGDAAAAGSKCLSTNILSPTNRL